MPQGRNEISHGSFSLVVQSRQSRLQKFQTVASLGLGLCLTPPTVKHTGQVSGSELFGNFLILIISMVKICKQCLQTDSASGGWSPPDPIPGLRPWIPLGRLSSPRFPGLTAPKWEFLSPTLVSVGERVKIRLQTQDHRLLLALWHTLLVEQASTLSVPYQFNSSSSPSSSSSSYSDTGALTDFSHSIFQSHLKTFLFHRLISWNYDHSLFGSHWRR